MLARAAKFADNGAARGVRSDVAARVSRAARFVAAAERVIATRCRLAAYVHKLRPFVVDSAPIIHICASNMVRGGGGGAVGVNLCVVLHV